MECNCNNNNSNGGVIPWVRGNRLPLVICVYEDVVTQEGEGSLVHNKMERVPYEIQAADTVTVVMKSGFRQVAMPFTTDGNKVMVTDNGELPKGSYTVEVTIERGDGARGRWQETRQVRIYENTSDAQLGEMYSIDADLFFYAKGDTGVGIADITPNQDNTLTITMTDGTTYTTEAVKGEKGDKGDTGERGTSIVSFDVTGQTDVSVIYTVTFSDDTTQDISVPKGPQGDTGLTGNGISSTTLNSDYTLTIAYTDGTTYTTPSIRGAQGAQGVSVIGFTQTGETATNTMYNLVFSDGRTQSVAIPKGTKGDKGDTGATGATGAQGPKGDTVTATDYTLYNAQGGSSEGAMSQDATTKAISAQTGYYTCGTVSGTAEKVVTVENGNLYKRTLGGHFKVKMTNANTAASGVTLQIGSETAAALWYNGAAVSATNTWDAGEVLSVYYDGSVYQASNAQGGGGMAEKIKYDNVQSGLAATNVQEALDATNQELTELAEELYGNINIVWVRGKYIATSQGVGATCPMAETTLREMDYAKIAATAGETYHLIGVGGSTPRLWAMVDLNTSKIISAANGNTSSLATPEDVTLTITQDCWLIVNVYNGNMNPPYQNRARTPYSLNRTAYGHLSKSRIDLLEEKDNSISVIWYGDGMIMSSTGETRAASDKKYSEYIDISDYDYLYISSIITTSITQAGLAFYDSSKEYISGEPCTFSFENGVDIRKYAVPSAAQYARVTFWNTDTYGTFKIYGAKATENNYELPNVSVYATNEYSNYGLAQGTFANGSFVSSETRVHLPLISVPTHVSVKSDYHIIIVSRTVNGSYNRTYDSIDNTYKLRRSLYLPKIDGVVYIVVIARKDNGAISPTDDIIEDMSYLDYEDKLANISSNDSNKLSMLMLSDEETVVGTAMNYILKDEYENSVRYLRLSEDCGKTWTSIENTFGDIVFVHWFSNGSLLFATPSKCYYSNDGLTTVNESELYDLDGTAFVAEATEHFFQNDQSRNPIMMVGNTELVAWGDYYFNEAAYKGRAWYSDDYGHSVRCFFKSGESVIGGNTISVRHTHGVLYDKYTEKFYLITGDFSSECCLIECVYSQGSWNLTLLGQGVNYKFGDIRFDKYFMYFVTDYTDTSLTSRGILRCPKNGLSNFANYKFIAKAPSSYTGSVLSFIEDRNGNKLMFPDYSGRGKIWYCRNTLDFETVLVSENYVLTNVTDPNYNGDVYCRKSLSTTPFKLNPMINLTKSMRNSGVKDFFDQNNIINVSSNEL